MSKFELSKGIKQEPEFLVVYGVEGIGKTTFASQAPNPVIVDIEGGSGEIDTTRISPDQLKTFHNVIDAIKHLSGEDGVGTIVIDSLSKLEQLIWKETCERKSKNGKTFKSIEDFVYKQGYIFALDEWQEFVEACGIARSQGKNVVIIGHTAAKNFDDPTMLEKYARYEIDIHPKASALLKKYVKAVLFANYKTLVKDGKGLETGERLIYTERRPGHDAKNRYGLPYEIPFNWEFYIQAKKDSVVTPESIKRQISGIITEVADDETRGKIEKAVASTNDVNTLKTYLERVNTIIGEQND